MNFLASCIEITLTPPPPDIFISDSNISWTVRAGGLSMWSGCDEREKVQLFYK